MQEFKRFSYGLLCLTAGFLMLGSLAYAQLIPHFIKYQGDIKKWIEPIGQEKDQGKDKDKDKDKDLYALTFRIYNLGAGGTALWEETHLAVSVKKGVFEVLLGSITPLDLKFDNDYWLSIEIDDRGEIDPREKMVSVGYAYMAEDSYRLGGRLADDYALMGHSHIGEDIVSPVAEAINADTVDGLHAHQIGGIKDHGELIGLADDDHLQYLDNLRGDERYAGLSWDGLTKLETAQSHIADKNNPHQVTLEQLGHLDNNPEEEAPAITERGEPTGIEIQEWADDIIAWGHTNLVANLNADMVDGFHATSSNNPQANTLIALDTTGKFPSGVIPSITNVDNADKVDGLHASVIPLASALYPLNANAMFPSSIIEGMVSDSDKLDGKDSSVFSLVGHFHTLMDLTDVTSDLRAAFLAAAAAGANGANRLATMTDIGGVSDLWTDEGTYIYPNNAGSGFQILDEGHLMIAGSAGIIDAATANPKGTLTIGQSLSGNNTDYSLIIARHGTNTNPGTYSHTAPALLVQDFSGSNAPLAIDRDGLVRINAYRIGDTTENAANVTLFNVTNDQGGALRVDGRRNTFIGYWNEVTSDEKGSLFVKDKVGIGTVTPSAKLDIATDTGDAISWGSTSEKYGIINFANSGGGGVQIYGTAGKQLHLGANDAIAMTIEQGGNVGIGTINPYIKLLVKQSVDNSNAGIAVLNTAASHTARMWMDGANFRITNDGNDGVAIDSGGNVGINTANPQGKLDVNGSIYQRGASLHADYVFEPDYKLESIEEHAKFMWQERHLKAVPKAAKTGEGQDIVELGGRDRGVLEELEKAHIYIAQLDERLKQLEAKLQQQNTDSR